MRAPVAEKLAELRRKIGQIPPHKTDRKGFTKAQRRTVLEMQEGRCAGCEAELQPGFHIDHVKPLAEGGPHEPGNWLGLCIPCHTIKTSREATERAKSKRIYRRETEGPKPATLHSGARLQSRPFPKDLRKKLNGQIVRREPA